MSSNFNIEIYSFNIYKLITIAFQVRLCRQFIFVKAKFSTKIEINRINLFYKIQLNLTKLKPENSNKLSNHNIFITIYKCKIRV